MPRLTVSYNQITIETHNRVNENTFLPSHFVTQHWMPKQTEISRPLTCEDSISFMDLFNVLLFMCEKAILHIKRLLRAIKKSLTKQKSKP